MFVVSEMIDWFPFERVKDRVAEIVKEGYTERTALADKMYAAIKEYGDDLDYCIVCKNHPDSGHSKDCAALLREKDHRVS